MQPTTDAGDTRRNEDLLRFVEQFGLLLHEAGMARMPARVFAFVLADDAESYTAADLATGLRVSPAAISGAVRTLIRAGLLARERLPGQRVDHYRVYDTDVWAAIVAQQSDALARHDCVIAEELRLLDPDSQGYRRVRETLEYYRFIRGELPALADRWREHRDELRRRWAAAEP